MKNDSVSANDDLKRWALQSLELTESVGTSSAIRLISEAGYFLSAESVEAVRVIAGSVGFPEQVTQAAFQQRMNEQVSQFVQSFFDIPPAPRSERWELLFQDCSDSPALRRWLKRIEPGLNLPELPSSNHFQENELIAECCQIFLARGSRQPRQRQQVIAMCHADPESWNPAIQELKAKHPQFVQAIAPWLNSLPLKDIPSDAWRPGLPGSATDERWPIVGALNKKIRDNPGIHLKYAFVLGLVVGGIRLLFDSPMTTQHSIDDSQRHLDYPYDFSPRKSQRDFGWSSAETNPVVAGQGLFVSTFLVSYFQSLRNSSPEVFNRLCEEVPGLENALLNPDSRAKLEAFVSTLLPDLDKTIRDRYRSRQIRIGDPAPVSATDSASTTTWIGELKAIVSQKPSTSDPPHPDDQAASAVAPENEAARE